MGRNVKPGISFYRMDSGHILNKKVRLLCNEFDSDGYYIWSCLVDYAYLNYGYYFNLNDKEEVELFASEFCKKKPSLVHEVIRGCIIRGLFDKYVADSFKILTCEMMQEVFLFATSERRAKGSTFKMQQDWLLLDFSAKIPLNIEIVQGKNKIFHRNNPQTKQDNTETRQELLAGKAATPEGILKDSSPKQGQDTGRKIFIPPTLDQVADYFLKKMHQPDNPGSWMPDQCKNESLQFFNHYKANGWVQGRGKPIKDWEAAASNWIINTKKGTFSPPSAISQNSYQPPAPSRELQQRTQNSWATDINYLYEAYKEDETKVTVISIESTWYNHLKNAKLFNFSDDKVTKIREQAIKEIKAAGMQDNEQFITTYMKKIAVLELFKELKEQGKEAVFNG